MHLWFALFQDVRLMLALSRWRIRVLCGTKVSLKSLSLPECSKTFEDFQFKLSLLQIIQIQIQFDSSLPIQTSINYLLGKSINKSDPSIHYQIVPGNLRPLLGGQEERCLCQALCRQHHPFQDGGCAAPLFHLCLASAQEFACQWGCHPERRDAVHPHAVPSELPCRRPHQPHHRMLRRRVWCRPQPRLVLCINIKTTFLQIRMFNWKYVSLFQLLKHIWRKIVVLYLASAHAGHAYDGPVQARCYHGSCRVLDRSCRTADVDGHDAVELA